MSLWLDNIYRLEPNKKLKNVADIIFFIFYITPVMSSILLPNNDNMTMNKVFAFSKLFKWKKNIMKSFNYCTCHGTPVFGQDMTAFKTHYSQLRQARPPTTHDTPWWSRPAPPRPCPQTSPPLSRTWNTSHKYTAVMTQTCQFTCLYVNNRESGSSTVHIPSSDSRVHGTLYYFKHKHIMHQMYVECLNLKITKISLFINGV